MASCVRRSRAAASGDALPAVDFSKLRRLFEPTQPEVKVSFIEPSADGVASKGTEPEEEVRRSVGGRPHVYTSVHIYMHTHIYAPMYVYPGTYISCIIPYIHISAYVLTSIHTHVRIHRDTNERRTSGSTPASPHSLPTAGPFARVHATCWVRLLRRLAARPSPGSDRPVGLMILDRASGSRRSRPPRTRCEPPSGASRSSARR